MEENNKMQELMNKLKQTNKKKTCIDQKSDESNINEYGMTLFYAKSAEEIEDYIFGYPENYDYKYFRYPALVLVKTYAEPDYEGGTDTIVSITEFNQYIVKSKIVCNFLD